MTLIYKYIAYLSIHFLKWQKKDFQIAALGELINLICNQAFATV